MAHHRLFATVLRALAGSAGAATGADALRDTVEQRLRGDRSGACFAVAVVDADVHRAFVCADADDEGRIGPDSRFEIGSISKTMMGALLADLIRAGKASLDDPLADLDLGQYEGSYRLAPQFSITFCVREGVLHAQGTAQPALPLAHAGPDTFVMERVGAELRFDLAMAA